MTTQEARGDAAMTSELAREGAFPHTSLMPSARFDERKQMFEAGARY
jgi:hypothetical protein